MIPLDPAFLTAPIAHRGLHDISGGRPENSLAGIDAAIAKGYGIEIDVQLSADNHAMVFHDYDLGRLTNAKGAIQGLSTAVLSQTPLTHGSEGIPTLPEVLKRVDGRVPLLIEIKDQDGQMGSDIGTLEAAVASDLEGYLGPVAVMSFNPHSVMAMAQASPKIARGLVTCAYTAEDWPLLPAKRREELAIIPDFQSCNASFISHDRKALTDPAVAQIKQRSLPVLCWTIRSNVQEADARKIADNITFEGYLP